MTDEPGTHPRMDDAAHAPHVGDTLSTSRAGRTDAIVGEGQGGSGAPPRASFSDPVVTETGPDGIPGQRIAGAAPSRSAHPEEGGDQAGRAVDPAHQPEQNVRMRTHDNSRTGSPRQEI